MPIKLFVDDIRACPDGWYPARTVTEAIRILATMPVQEVSLDHDIACRLVSGHEHTSEETFEAVARYIALMSPRPAVRIHTSDYPAGTRMAKILGIVPLAGRGVSNREKHLRHALILALDLIAELRGYTADWDWKYKDDWDAQEAEVRQYLEPLGDS